MCGAERVLLIVLFAIASYVQPNIITNFTLSLPRSGAKKQFVCPANKFCPAGTAARSIVQAGSNRIITVFSNVRSCDVRPEVDQCTWHRFTAACTRTTPHPDYADAPPCNTINDIPYYLEIPELFPKAKEVARQRRLLSLLGVELEEPENIPSDEKVMIKVLAEHVRGFVEDREGRRVAEKGGEFGFSRKSSKTVRGAAGASSSSSSGISSSSEENSLLLSRARRLYANFTKSERDLIEREEEKLHEDAAYMLLHIARESGTAEVADKDVTSMLRALGTEQIERQGQEVEYWN